MTEKLTAKLSDGREYEVEQNYPTVHDPLLMVAVLKPIKREPRYWWCVVRRAADHSALFIAHTEDEARGMVRTWDIGERAEVVKVREVLE